MSFLTSFKRQTVSLFGHLFQFCALLWTAVQVR